MTYFSKVEKKLKIEKVFNYIKDNPGVDINSICSFVNTSKKTVGKYLEFLEEEGQIYFTLSDFNKRFYFIKEDCIKKEKDVKEENQKDLKTRKIKNGNTIRILEYIKNNNGVTIKEIYEHFHLNPGNVSPILSMLVKQNKIIRNTDTYPSSYSYNNEPNKVLNKLPKKNNSTKQQDILEYLKTKKEKGANYKELAKQFNIKTNRITHIMNALILKGYVVKDITHRPIVYYYNDENIKTNTNTNTKEDILENLISKVNNLITELSEIENRKKYINDTLAKLKEILVDELEITDMRILLLQKEIEIAEKSANINLA